MRPTTLFKECPGLRKQNKKKNNRVLYSWMNFFCLISMWPELMYLKSLHVTPLICNDWWYVHMQRPFHASAREEASPWTTECWMWPCKAVKGFVHLYITMIVGKINRWTKKRHLVRPHLHSLSCDVSTWVFFCSSAWARSERAFFRFLHLMETPSNMHRQSFASIRLFSTGLRLCHFSASFEVLLGL